MELNYNNPITYGRGYVYKIQYHIVWCTKYRKQVLNNGIDTELLQLTNEMCKELDISIITSECMPDHIHLLIDCSPQHFIPTIIKVLKGRTAKQLLEMHPQLKNELWGGHLWNPSYFVATVSETTEQQIKEYIDNQKTSTRKYIKK